MQGPEIIIYNPTARKKMYIDKKIAQIEEEIARKRLEANLKSKTARLVETDDSPAPAAYVAKQDRTVYAFKGNQLDIICSYLKNTYRYREYMLFVVGANFGLRYSDLKNLRFSDFMDSAGHFYEEIPPRLETKTSKSHKSNRHIYINAAVREAVTIYLDNNDCSINDYLFPSVRDKSKPMGNKYMNRLIKEIAYESGVKGKFGTHSFRKTFGCNYMKSHQDDPFALNKLQKIFGHASQESTLSYIGVTAEDIKEAYNMNLGAQSESVSSNANEISNNTSKINTGMPCTKSKPFVLHPVTQEDIQNLLADMAHG